MYHIYHHVYMSLYMYIHHHPPPLPLMYGKVSLGPSYSSSKCTERNILNAKCAVNRFNCGAKAATR